MDSLNTSDQRPLLCIFGAAGGFGHRAANYYSSTHQIIGIDHQSKPERFPGEFYQLRYTQRTVTELFRQYRFPKILHCGRIRPSSQVSRRFRYMQNVMGIHELLNHAKRYGCEQFIGLSSHWVYGAYPSNHLYIREQETLRASEKFSEWSDAVDFDTQMTTFLWKEQRRLKTIVLRPVTVVGPDCHSPITRMLKEKNCPTILGYNPLMQFIHQEDLLLAIDKVLENKGTKKSGVFNISGEGPVPLHTAINLSGGRVNQTLPWLAQRKAHRMGFSISQKMLDSFKFPVVVNDKAFRRNFGYSPSRNLVETLTSTLS